MSEPIRLWRSCKARISGRGRRSKNPEMEYHGGTVDIEVEAGNLTEAKYKAENAFDQLSDRKLIANISDFIAEDAEEIA